MNTEKNTPTQSESIGSKPKVTELYWIKTENPTLTFDRGGRRRVYRDITIIWEAERDEVPFSYESKFSEGREMGKYVRREVTLMEDYVPRLLTFEEAQSVLSVLETEIGGIHLLSRVSLPLEKEKLTPILLCSNSSTEGHLVRGLYDLETATYVFEERDGMPYRTVQLDLPVELADRLERMPYPEVYIARLEDVDERVGQLINDIYIPRFEGAEASEVSIARLEDVHEKVEQAIEDIRVLQPDPWPYDSF